ncbi:hypothetical protein ACVWXL_000404 [Bradyrhizobium sp. GM22.5]
MIFWLPKLCILARHHDVGEHGQFVPAAETYAFNGCNDGLHAGRNISPIIPPDRVVDGFEPALLHFLDVRARTKEGVASCEHDATYLLVGNGSAAGLRNMCDEFIAESVSFRMSIHAQQPNMSGRRGRDDEV